MYRTLVSKLSTNLYRGWWIVVICVVAQIVSSGTTGYVFSILVVPMEEDLGWNRATMYGVLSLGALTGSLLSVPLGPLFDRYGARVMMTLSAGFGGICVVLVGWISQPWQFYLLLGGGVAITRPALQTLGPRTAAANWFIKKRPAAFAMLTAGAPLSGILLVPLAAWIITSLGWRAVWISLGLLELLLIMPLTWITIRRRPEDLGLLPDGEAAEQPAKRTDNVVQRANSNADSLNDAWTPTLALKTRTFWLLILGFLLISFPASTVLVHLVPFWLDKGLSQGEATGLYSLYALVALAARPLWAVLVSRFGVHHCLTAFAFLYGASTVFLTFASGLALVALAGFGQAIVIGGYGQMQAQILPDYFGRSSVGTLTGYSSFLTLPAMAASPFLTALLHDLTKSYIAALSAYSVLAFLAVLSFFFAQNPGRPLKGRRQVQSF